ncbi:MAG TPA: hypothetical protein VNV41_00640 [Candidatus Acidoferrales bacterium]|nr:hypothetical protein [Candidatus Acidoferrales bacterium]
MLSQRPTRYLVIPVTLLVLLLVGMTLGSVVWHHHDGSAEATCPICHLSHQPIDRPIATTHAPTFALVAPTPEPRDAGLAPSPTVRRVPARAPPTA